MFLFNGLLLAGTLIFEGDFGNLPGNTIAEVGEKNINFLKYLLISQDISLFIVPAIIILTLMKPGHQIRLMDMKMPRINEIVLVIVLAFCIFPITSFTGQLNSGMHLPDWLSGVEQWMIEKEDNATRLTDSLMTSNTFWIMILNVLVIAVMPAIGEELIFRGIFQKIFYNLFKSGHLAIWFTAFVFSAIHFQFFGFVPRFILGLVFGYLFLWSGTLWLPVISHFVNNAVPVIGAYIQGWEKSNAPMDITLWKQIIGLPLPIIISIIILLYFRNKNKKEATSGFNESQLTN
jgi:membrane protease YdiL (CAAX protease family)